MGYYIAIPILAVAVALQATVLPLVRFYSGQLEVSTIIVLAWSLHASWEEAVFWALVGGIMQDLLAMSPTGITSISLVIIVFGIKWLTQNVYRFNLAILLGAVLLETVLRHAIMAAVLGLLDYIPDTAQMIRLFTAPTIALNVIGAVPIYVILRIIQARIPRPQSNWDISV